MTEPTDGFDLEALRRRVEADNAKGHGFWITITEVRTLIAAAQEIENYQADHQTLIGLLAERNAQLAAKDAEIERLK